jgi:hypothetical protein
MDHGRCGVVRFGWTKAGEMIGNKAGFNDSIEEWRVMPPVNEGGERNAVKRGMIA